MQVRTPIRGKTFSPVRQSLSGGRTNFPRTGLLFCARYPGLVDTIGLSASDYLLIDPALRSIFFVDSTTLRDTAEALTIALASPLLNAEGLIGKTGYVVLYQASSTEETLARARRVVGVSRSYLLTFTTVAYNAAWTAPSITAATLLDANVTWVAPDGTAVTGKTPAMTSFSQTGKYRCKVTDWSKVTSFRFYPGSTQSWVSLINLDVMFPLMTGLLTCNIQGMPSLISDITNWIVPSTMTSLLYYLKNCSGLVGDISAHRMPVGVTSAVELHFNNPLITGNISNYLISAVLDNATDAFRVCTQLSGIFNGPTAQSVCRLYDRIFRDNVLVSSDVSTWIWKTTITSALIANTRFTYGTGQALRSNVRNGLAFGLDNCALPASDVGRVLIDINMSGATGVGGSIALNSNNIAPVWGTEAAPSDVAYAVADLIYKNWSSIAVTGGIPAWVLAL